MNEKIILKNILDLVPSSLESKLMGASLYEWDKTNKIIKLKQEFINSNLIIDLNRVRWVEPSALVQLVLIIEDVLRQGATVKIAMPLISPSYYERQTERKISVLERYSRNRTSVLRFLEYLNFINVLTAPHIQEYPGNIEILYDFDISEYIKGADFEIDTEKYSDPYEIIGNQDDIYYGNYFPLRWLSNKDDEETKKIALFFANVIGEKYGGIYKVDAREITNVILYELVENVANYSGLSNYALVTARTMTKSRSAWIRDQLAPEKDFFDWLEYTPTNVAEIIVGDSGLGIYNTLLNSFNTTKHSKTYSDIEGEIAKVLLWSFEKFSTSKNMDTLRGTRGLYRVNRIVQRYNGLITIRSNNQFVGWDHGGLGYDNEFYYDRQKYGQLYRIPGNLLHVRMPVFRDTNPRWRQPKHVKEYSSFSVIKLGPLIEEGFSNEDQEKLIQEISQYENENNHCLLVMIDGGNESSLSIEHALKKACDLRHPSAMVLFGIPGGWGQIEGIIESLNVEYDKQELRAEKASSTQRLDPILVIYDLEKNGWVGTSENKLEILKKLTIQNKLNKNEYNEIISDETEQIRTLGELKEDNRLFKINQDDSVELVFSINDIWNYISELFSSKVTSELTQSDEFAYRTPNLNLVKKWIDYNSIISKSLNYSLVALSFASKIIDNNEWKKYEKKANVLDDILFVESHSSNEISKSLQQILKIPNRKFFIDDIDILYSSSISFLPENRHIIIYEDIISTGESTLTLLKQILRDNSYPVVILCLINGLKGGKAEIELWGYTIPIISYFQIDLGVEEISDAKIKNIDAISYKIENNSTDPLQKITDKLVTNRIDLSKLRELIINSSSLYFSHISRPLGRHFSFYLNPESLFFSTEVIQKYISLIDKWKEEISKFPNESVEINKSKKAISKINDIKKISNKIEIWFPQGLPDSFLPSKKLALKLKELRNDVLHIREVPRMSAFGKWTMTVSDESDLFSENVVIIDWGILTGNTLTQLINVAGMLGAKNIYALIFMCQLNFEEENFLSNLKLMHTYKIINKKTNSDLFESNEVEIADDESRIKVDFLTNLPIVAYSSSSCPICKKQQYYNADYYPTKLLSEYSLSEKNKYALKKYDEVLMDSPENFEKKPLDQVEAFSNLINRKNIREALYSTNKRFLLYCNLITLRNNYYESEKLSKELVYLINLLSVENDWLKKPPLCFKAIRDLFGELSRDIIIDSNINDPSLKSAALSLLRYSSKYIFINNISLIFLKVHTYNSVINSLLFHIFTLLIRPYHQRATFLVLLKKELNIILNDIKNKKIELSDEVVSTIYRLEFMAERSESIAVLLNKTPKEAWDLLRGKFNSTIPKKHGSALEAFSKMGLIHSHVDSIQKYILEKKARTNSPLILDEALLSVIKDMNANWDKCCRYLELEILPHLRRLKEFFDSNVIDGFFNLETSNQIIALSHSVTLLDESDFSKTIKRIVSDPKLIFQSEIWNKFYYEFNWFEDVFFTTKAENKKSLLYFLNSVPTKIYGPLDNIKCKKIVNITTNIDVSFKIDIDAAIFCSKPIFDEILFHIFDNLDKHFNKDNPKKEVSLDVEVDGDRDYITIKFSNSNTKIKENPGEGLEIIRKKLVPFGADFIPDTRPSDKRYSYVIEYKFIRG